MGEKVNILVQNGWQKLNSFYDEKIDGNRFLRILSFILLFLFIGLMLFRLNRPTPWVVDDLIKQQTARNIHSFSQLCAMAKSFYLHWGGRVWGEIYAQLFLMLPKHRFDYINTAGYMVLLLLIEWNIWGNWKLVPEILIGIHFSLLLCLPAFGQDILWISGTANYMWASLLPLLFLGFWRHYEVQQDERMNHPLALCGFFILGIMAGWANENVSVGLLIIAAGYMMIFKKETGRVPRFSYAGILGLLAGSLALWMAPGNFARFAAEKHSRSILHMARMVIHNTLVLFDPSITLLLMVAFVLLWAGIKNGKKASALNYFVGAVISSIAFSVIGGMHTRVFFGTTVLMIVAVGILYVQWGQSIKVRKIQFVLAVLFLLGSVGFYKQGRDGIKDYAARWNYNQQIIQSEKQKGNLDIYVNPMPAKNKFCATYGLDDFKPKKQNHHWLNEGVAKYFGIHTIQSVYVEK